MTLKFDLLFTKTPFTTRWGYGGRILDLNPPASVSWTMTFESEVLLIVAIYIWLPPASYVVILTTPVEASATIVLLICNLYAVSSCFCAWSEVAEKRLSDVWGEVDWLLNVTINDILVIYVTAHWCAGGKRVHLMYFWTVTVMVVIMTSVTIKVNRPRYRIQTHYTIMNRVAPHACSWSWNCWVELNSFV